MAVENLLIELGTEELPPKSLKKLAQALSDNMAAELNSAELGFHSICWYASARRLAVYVTQLQATQADKLVEKRGPAVAAAFEQDGSPTKAAMGWAKSNGIEVSQAERLSTDKGEWLLYKSVQTGQRIQVLLPAMLAKALKGLPIPKPMRWGSKNDQFIRPVHTLCLLYGEQLIEGEVLGIQASKRIQGHRFHGQGSFTLQHADDYLSALEKEYVLADFNARRDKIKQDVENAAITLEGIADMSDELLDEVTALVEWPVVMTASFEERFLQVPKEALMYTMKDDQKYFPVLSQTGQLKPNFIFVSNIDSADPTQVIQGNEKVVRPRLADAEFFFNSDKKHTLESRLDSLQSVLFQKQLGSVKDKSQRIANLAKFIAEQIGVDATQAYRAGLLSKTDLVSSVVMEFPEVQGLMGMHYARLDGEDEPVALALNEQYMPRFAGDQLPTTGISRAVALADKLDTLVGIFGIGQLPKGDKDPFALRRAAIGLLRIIIDAKLDLDLTLLVNQAVNNYSDLLSNDNTAQQVVEFVLSRFKAFYQEQGISTDVVQAVASQRPTRPADFDARVKGVDKFKLLAAAASLAAANKRVANILSKNRLDDEPLSWQDTLLVEEAEVSLATKLSHVSQLVHSHLEQGDYATALSTLAELREPIDLFFDNVMVIVEDAPLKRNRLALLNALRNQFLNVADISLLETTGH